jgi:putative transposase
LSHHHTEKPKNVDYFQVPRPLWRQVKKLLPKAAKKGKVGRRPADNRAILNGIWYVLWTSCQWKAIHKDWFGVCSSVLHQRFQLWQQLGIFEKLMTKMVEFYDKKHHIKWKWQALDSKSCPAPLGGDETGKNPTDRAKKGSKLHLLVDQRGAPLSLYLSGANAHDKWFADDLIMVMVVKRPPKRKQHLCADKGYAYTDVRQFVEQAGYIVHIKHKRKRGEPALEECPIPGETRYPARRWVVERTLAWLTKRRSLRTRWCKKSQNWLAFVQFACAHILMDLAIYG